MEEYKSNSLKVRDGDQVANTTEKRIESVVSGHAQTQKKSGLSRFAGSIITESFENVGAWLFQEVVIPNIKKAISDLVTNGVDMLLYGKASGPSRGSSISKISYSGSSYYNYSKLSKEPVRANSVDNGFDYDNIVFDSRGDAEAVLTSMEELVDQFEVVSVGDFYELAGVAAPNYTVNKYGWTSLRGAQVLRCRDGYIVKLPKAIVLS